MKKILLILTGGTICSKFSGNVKIQGTGTQTVLENSFLNSASPFAGHVKFTSTENYGIFSENMTAAKWNRLIKLFADMPAFRDTAAFFGCYPSLKNVGTKQTDNAHDGIIILHGTDTLGYSSALFSVLLRDMGVPVFFVSSNEALSAPTANGADNFRAAVDCICAGISPNVYVSYKNPGNGRMYLHIASRLKQCQNGSEDFFSAGMTDISDFTPDAAKKYFRLLPCREREKTGCPVIDMFAGIKLTDSVLRIEPYTGLNYTFFNFSGVRAILHGTYHSGTVCTESAPEEYNNSILRLIETCKDTPVYISPSDITGVVYDTLCTIKSGRENVFFVFGMTNEMLYAKLLIACSCFNTQSEINDFIYSEYNLENEVCRLVK